MKQIVLTVEPTKETLRFWVYEDPDREVILHVRKTAVGPDVPRQMKVVLTDETRPVVGGDG